MTHIFTSLFFIFLCYALNGSDIRKLTDNDKPWRWKDKDFPRVIALLEFERFILANNIFCKKGLALNGLDPEWHYLPFEKNLFS